MSIRSASSAGCMRARSDSSRSLRSVASASAPMSGRSGLPPRARARPGRRRGRPSPRRRARRPCRCRGPRSPRRPSAASSRCRSRITSRTCGCRATTETIRSTRARRIAAVTSLPLMKTRPSSSKVTGFSRASAPSGAPSPSGTPCWSASQVSARYIAPGVEVAEAEPLRERARDGALAGPGRAVDGDDHLPLGRS